MGGFSSPQVPTMGRRSALHTAFGTAAGLVTTSVLVSCGRPVAAPAKASSTSKATTSTPAVKHLPATGTPAWPVNVATAQPTAAWSMYGTKGPRIELVTFGRDIWNKHDDCAFYYTHAKGDGVWSSKVALLANTNGWAKAGIMLRNATDPGSAMCFCCLSASNGAHFQWRQAKDQPCHDKGFDGAAAAPIYLRLRKKGDVFTVQDSPDGKKWGNTLTGPLKGVIGANYLVGLAACSHAANLQGLAGFNDVSFKPSHYSAIRQTSIPSNW